MRQQQQPMPKEAPFSTPTCTRDQSSAFPDHFSRKKEGRESESGVAFDGGTIRTRQIFGSRLVLVSEVFLCPCQFPLGRWWWRWSGEGSWRRFLLFAMLPFIHPSSTVYELYLIFRNVCWTLSRFIERGRTLHILYYVLYHKRYTIIQYK